MSFPAEYKSHLLETLDRIDLPTVDRVIALLAKARDEGRQIFVCGNGGSAATANHFACDMVKGASYMREKRFRIMALSEQIPTITAYSNDVSYDADGSTADAAAGVNASSGEEDVMANTVAKSQTIVTPNSILSMSKSRSVARDAAGEEGMASVISRAMALNTPGTVKVDADTRNHSSIEGEGEATAFGDAAATVDEAGNMTADTSASSLVELQ